MAGLSGSLRWGLTQTLLRDYTRLCGIRHASAQVPATAAAATPAASSAKAPDMWDAWNEVYIPNHPYTPMPKDFKEHPERDLVNFPHPEVPQWPSKVRFGFIPDSWFQFFQPKTGATGPYVFGYGFIAFCISKEIFVIDPETLTAPSFFMCIYMINRLFGKSVAKYIDDDAHKELAADEKWRSDAQDNLKHVIAEETRHQAALKESLPLLVQAKKDNIALQQEAEYRSRLALVHSEVKRRLDFMLETEAAKRRVQHKHMVDWVTAQVKASITPEKQKAFLSQCIADLQGLAKKATAV